MAKQRWLAAAVALLLATGCSEPIAKRGRYRMARDPGSRHGFQYVKDTETGMWVNRECELRVAEARELPEPLQDDVHGSKLDVSIFRPESVDSGLLLSTDFQRRDGTASGPAHRCCTRRTSQAESPTASR